MNIVLPRILLMLLSPVAVLWHDLKHSSLKTKKWSLILFVTFFGSAITFKPSWTGPDGSQYWIAVYTYYLNMSFAQFWHGLIGILSFNPPLYAKGDVYIHVLSYLTGSVLRMPGLFIIFAAFVYGYFFSSSLFKVIPKLPKVKYPYLVYGVMVIFILWSNLEGVSTFRTWTGMWILFYGAVCYFDTKKKKYLFLMAVSPFVHLGYFIMAIPAFIVAIWGNYTRIYTEIGRASCRERV